MFSDVLACIFENPKQLSVKNPSNPDGRTNFIGGAATKAMTYVRLIQAISLMEAKAS